MNAETHIQTNDLAAKQATLSAAVVRHRCGHRRQPGTLFSYAVTPGAMSEYVAYLESSVCPECCAWHSHPRLNEALATATYRVVDGIESAALGLVRAVRWTMAALRPGRSRRHLKVVDPKQSLAL